MSDMGEGAGELARWADDGGPTPLDLREQLLDFREQLHELGVTPRIARIMLSGFFRLLMPPSDVRNKVEEMFFEDLGTQAHESALSHTWLIGRRS